MCRFVFFVAFLSVGFSVRADDVVTECPTSSRGEPLNWATMLHSGTASWGAGQSHMVKEGDVEHWIEIHSDPEFESAVLQCTYKDKSVLRLPIPGLLREYHVKLRPIYPWPPVRKEFIRVWAVSETGGK